MPLTNGIISAPVSVSDVRSALGETSTDVGTLCKSAKINVWSKIKPIRYPSLGVLPASVFEEEHGAIVVHTYPSYQDLARKAAGQGGGLVEHSYDRPTGGLASPYRLTDFNGYNHFAQCPFALTVEAALVGGNLQATTTIDTDIMESWGYDLTGFTFGLWIPGKGVYMMSTVNGITAITGRELHFNVPLPASGSEYGDVNFTAGTTYTAKVIMTDYWATYTSEQGNRWYSSPGSESTTAQWIVLPADSYPTFTPATAPTVLDKVSLSASGTATYSEPNGLPTYSNVQISAQMVVAAGVSGTWYARVDFIAKNVVGDNNVTSDQTIATWSGITLPSSATTLTKSLSYTGSLQMAAYPKDEGEFQLQMQLTLWQTGGDTYTQTDTIYLQVS